MLVKARKVLQKRQTEDRVELHRADAEKLPLVSSLVDAICTSFTFECSTRPTCQSSLTNGSGSSCRAAVWSLLRCRKRPGLILDAFESTHRHFPNLMDCRPIYTRRAVESAGFSITAAEIDKMWVLVEIVMVVKPE